MSAKLQVVVLSSIDWSAAWQRHQIFADQFAAAGYEVFFVENTGFRDPRFSDLPRLIRRLANILRPNPRDGTNAVPPGVRLISPAVLPPVRGLARAVNALLLTPALARQLRRAGLRDGALAIVYFPTATTVDLIDRLRPSKIVYDCASNFRGHRDAPPDIATLEQGLLSRSDLVVTDSDFLYDQKKREHAHVVQIHQGVSPRFFDATPPSPQWRRLCYYGTWIPEADPSFLIALADAGLDITISGFIKAPVPRHPRIAVLPPVDSSKLVERLETFDGFLMPYHITEFMRGVVPAKIYECLAMGRPVLAVPLPSLKPYKDLIYIAETPQEWIRIAQELPRTETDERRRRRIAAARGHTHAREFERLLAAIVAASPKR